MSENTQEQTNPETQAPAMTPKEQASEAVRIAKHLAKGENMLLEREIWSYLQALTASGVNENQKLQLKKSMARAIQFGVNFMSGDTPVQLQNHGRLAKLENNLARAIVKLAETNTLIMADRMAKAEEEQEQAFNKAQENNSETQTQEEVK